MIPHERSLVKQMEKEPFALIGVNSDDSIETLHKQMKDEGVTWRSFFDGGGIGGPIATRWDVSGWPTIYVLDKKGVIRFTGVRDDEMTKAVEKLLAEKDD